MQAPTWVERNIDLEIYREKQTTVSQLNQFHFRCLSLHLNKIGEVSKPGDVKKMAKTIEFELERKRNEKIKNHEFNNSGKQKRISDSFYREEHCHQQSQPNPLE